MKRRRHTPFNMTNQVVLLSEAMSLRISYLHISCTGVFLVVLFDKIIHFKDVELLKNKTF